jgi:hypothetical protein
MSAKREPITDDQLQGFKYFLKFLPVLARLHDHATSRDKAGNRELHFDQEAKRGSLLLMRLTSYRRRASARGLPDTARRETMPGSGG